MPYRSVFWALTLLILCDCAATNLDSRRYRRVSRPFSKMFIHVENPDNSPFLDKLGEELTERLQNDHNMEVGLFSVDSLSLREKLDEKTILKDFAPQALLDIRLTSPEYSSIPAEPNKGPFVVDVYAGARYTLDLFIYQDPKRIWRGRLKTRELLQTSAAVQQSSRQIIRSLSHLSYIPRERKEKTPREDKKKEAASGK